jgi:hypothetical protein
VKGRGRGRMKALAAAATVVAVCLVAVAVQSQGPAVGSRAAQLLAAAHQDTLQYVYMPAAAAKDARARSAMLNALLTQSLDDKLGDGLGNNKSCAISSLVAQANFIFPHWYAAPPLARTGSFRAVCPSSAFS